jgi:PilZ domain
MIEFTKKTPLSFLKHFLKERHFKRAFERYQCSVDVIMLCAPRMTSLNGRMINISRGGGMFRPCLSYLMDRRGYEGFIVAANMRIPARIVRTLTCGYAIQFVNILSEEDLQTVRHSALKIEDAA